MRIFKSGPKPEPVLDPQLKAALEQPLERLRRGEPGVDVKDVAALLDQFKGHSKEQLRLARQLIIDADPSVIAAFKGSENDPTRDAPTAERLVRLLSGEAHGLKQVPTTLKEADAQLWDAHVAVWEASDEAYGAVEQLTGLGANPSALSSSQLYAFESMFALGRRTSERDALTEATRALKDLKPGGAPVFSPRVFELMSQPLGDGRPTLGDLVIALVDGKPALELRDVPVLLDRLLDLNPYELKQLRRALVPGKSDDAKYQALGEQNPLQGIATGDKIIAMLSGVALGHTPHPTPPEQASRDAAALRERAAKSGGGERGKLEASAAALDAAAEQLKGVKRLSGMQQTSWMVSVSARTGVKGVASTGYERILGQTAVDRDTGERETQWSNQVFVRTPFTLNSLTWAKHLDTKLEYGVNAPYVYGAVNNPLFGPRVGFHIPLVASGTLSANGTIGFGLVFATPIPLLNFGVTVYVTSPRLLTVIDPVMDALERVGQAVKPLTAPISDYFENLRHPVKEPENAGGPKLWDAAGKPGDVSAGDTVTVTGPMTLRLDGHLIELALAPGGDPANVQLGTSGQGLRLTLDGQTHDLAAATGKARIVIGESAVLVQLGDGPAARGLKLDR